MNCNIFYIPEVGDLFFNLFCLTHTTNEAYIYDSVGNRLTRPLTMDTMTYSKGNEQLNINAATYEYDLNGNRVKKTEGTTITTCAYADETVPRAAQPSPAPTIPSAEESRRMSTGPSHSIVYSETIFRRHHTSVVSHKRLVLSLFVLRERGNVQPG